jgi:hypothetical protein
MVIAILGWGSLLWDKQEQFDTCHEPTWHPDGPILPLEFSRISGTRGGALTLVIDEPNGAPCTVSYCFSKRRCLEDAKADLRCREGTILRCIGEYEKASDKLPEENQASAQVIKDWAASKGNVGAVVWTSLQSNFERTHGSPFSVSAAITHLTNLLPEHKAKAAEYIWRTPEFVQTPLRSAVQTAPWFKANHS